MAATRTYARRVVTRVTDVWAAHPVAVAYATAIARVWGAGIDGRRGTILAGPSDYYYEGYANVPPGLFTGWNPSAQTSVGTPLTTPGGLPGTSLPLGSSSPLDAAVAQMTTGDT